VLCSAKGQITVYPDAKNMKAVWWQSSSKIFQTDWLNVLNIPSAQFAYSCNKLERLSVEKTLYFIRNF
jgi:hypothetical protein